MIPARGPTIHEDSASNYCIFPMAVPFSRIRQGMVALANTIHKRGALAGFRTFCRRISNQALSDVGGRSIFDEDWDLCVVLDGCRADELERKQDSFSWLGEVGRYPSLASCTWNWLPQTIESTPDDVLRNTAYICANPFSNQFCFADQFYTLDEVWRYAWNAEKGTVLPRPVTDRAITHGRSTDAERLLVHYMQPHVPFLTDNAQSISQENFDPDSLSTADDWDRVARGELSRATAISWYRQTLTKVLQDVDLLLSNMDADTAVITADHGEAFGERGLYGHPSNTDLSCLTHVPWIETTATDQETHIPSKYTGTSNDITQEERLKALGYKTD